MSDSPLQALLRAIDALDIDEVMGHFAAQATMTTVVGDDAHGQDGLRAVLGAFFAELRGTRHEVTSEWHPEPDVWIAELSATYELTDFSRRGPYRRAMILRTGAEGIEQLRMYGAHELPLPEAGSYKEVRSPYGWLPTL